MSVVSLLVVLILVGVALYVIGLLPIDATVKRIIWAIAIVCVECRRRTSREWARKQR